MNFRRTKAATIANSSNGSGRSRGQKRTTKINCNNEIQALKQAEANLRTANENYNLLIKNTLRKTQNTKTT